MRWRSTWPPGWWRSVPRLPRRPAWLRREPDVAVPPPSAAAGREPRILATRGAPMPFSKGRMAQALVLAGADPERAYQIAMRIENFLALSNNPEFFKSITVPDLESFYWRGPTARQLAFEHWGV